MDSGATREFVSSAWATGGTLIGTLERHIAIPNLSPAFDPEWGTNGLMDQAASCLADGVWALLEDFKKLGVPVDDITVRIVGGSDAPVPDDFGARRTPVLLVEIPAFGSARTDGAILLYGHLDKQPGLAEKWSPGLGPQTPVVRDGRLYGRGGADDGYALFAALTAVMAVRNQGKAHARAVILMEAAEESASGDLEYYIHALKETLGDVGLVVCLDSGCQNYDQLWITESLRGVVSGTLRIAVSAEGVHSGDASGVIPAPFRILTQLLSRVENGETGEIFPEQLKVTIPAAIREGAARTVAVLGDRLVRQFPFLEGVRPARSDLVELALARTWETQLVIKGLDGFPPCAGSGNVLLPELTASLSFRLPPTLDCNAASAFVKATLEKDPPYGAQVSYTADGVGQGWAAPKTPAWLDAALREGSRDFFGNDAMRQGEGGSIPFMSLLGRVFPKANYLIAGVLGPQANAHGPDEFLHLGMAEKLTMCVARVVHDHALAGGK